MIDELERIVVVIPARNEERLLGRCLESVQAAAQMLLASRPMLRVQTVLVLDSCTDRSALIATGHEQVHVVETRAGSAGAARAAGIEAALSGRTTNELHRTWIANTDADSRVRVRWLAEHLAAAESGADLLVGAVEPDPADLDPVTLSRWWQRHTLTDGHHHVFGANLGIHARAYRAIGGFSARPTGEDVALVAAARAAGLDVRSSGRCPVVTSGRGAGRAPAGFADYLRTIAAE